MARKKHPILTVLAIIGVAGLILGAAAVAILSMYTPSSPLSFKEKLGVIPIEGTIVDSQDITSQLVTFRKDRKIRAIILRINSPGGAVGPTQEIYREVQKTARTKRVVSSLGGLAASGGYYIAAASDKIVANPGTITGSIGVLIEFIQIEDLLNKIGIQLQVVKSGEFKDIGSPHRKLTDRDKELINALIEDIQKQFVEGVAKGRNLSLEEVQEIADGRVFTGAQAKELGLIDVLGNFQDAVEIAKDMAGIKGEVALVFPKKTGSRLWDFVFGSATQSLNALIQRMKIRIEYKWSGLSGK
jgi:protease-4